MPPPPPPLDTLGSGNNMKKMVSMRNMGSNNNTMTADTTSGLGPDLGLHLKSVQLKKTQTTRNLKDGDTSYVPQVTQMSTLSAQILQKTKLMRVDDDNSDEEEDL